MLQESYSRGARRTPAHRRGDHRGTGLPPDLVPPRGRNGLNTPLPRVGTTTIAAGTVARIIQAPAATAGFNASALGGHSLKRGELSTGMGCGHEVKNDV